MATQGLERSPEHDRVEQFAAEWYRLVERAVEEMMMAREVSESVAETIDGIAERLGEQSPRLFLAGMDPYLGQSLLSAALACEKGLRAANPDLARRRVRLGLERLRQALRDVLDEGPTSETQSGKEVARWLVQTVSLPQAQVADLLGVSPRTLQRWISTQDSAKPEGEDESRLRAVARVTSHLRHVFTSPGVVRWFERPNPHNDDQPPRMLLDDATQIPRLLRLASMSRSTLVS